MSLRTFFIRLKRHFFVSSQINEATKLMSSLPDGYYKTEALLSVASSAYCCGNMSLFKQLTQQIPNFNFDADISYKVLTTFIYVGNYDKFWETVEIVNNKTSNIPLYFLAKSQAKRREYDSEV
jgi:hypothetical protein